MSLPTGLVHEVANNDQIQPIKELIFQVLEEFGLVPDDPELDGDLDDIEKHYQNGYFGIIKNRENDIIATFALFRLSEGVAEIRKMYLLPEYRSLGIGKWMLHYLIEKARELNYNKVELKTASVLTAAIKLYQKTGFEEVTTSDASPRCDRAFQMYL